MKKNIVFLILLFSLVINLNAQNRVTNSSNNYFIQNNGQWDKKAKYLTQMNNANIWITDEGIIYDLFKIEYPPQDIDKRKRFDITEETYKIDGQVVSMKFVGSDKDASFAGIEKLTTYHNYFLGNDETKWTTNVPLYKKIEVKEIYSGIDQRFYYDDDYVRYDIIVKPGANPSKISMEFTGADAISIANNELLISTKFGDVKSNKLYVYQEVSGKREEIECKFVKDEIGNISFTVGKYDKSAELIIDPLIYCTYLGGKSLEWPRSIKADKDGNSYITGWTKSKNFPTLNQYQGYQGVEGKDANCFITKLSPDGSSAIFSTYYGGEGESECQDLALDEKNNIYVCGHDCGKAFVSVFNPEGNQLLYSTTIGGGNTAMGITLDKNNDIYICGHTATNNPRTSAFVTKLVKNGDSYRRVYHTLIPCIMLANVVVDNDGNAYSAGWSNFGNQNTDFWYYTNIGFFKVNDITGMVFLKDINGVDERGYPHPSWIKSVGINNNNEIYMVGFTVYKDFPVTQDAYRKIHYGNRDGFITKFNSDGDILYSTFFGNRNSFNLIQSMCFDRFGRTIIMGHMFAPPNPIFPSTSIGMFVTRFKLGDKEISYSESIKTGGSDALNLAASVYAQGEHIYVCTHTVDGNLATPGAYQTKQGGDYDAAVFKFDATSYYDVIGQIFYNNDVLAGATVNLIGSDGLVTTTVASNNGVFHFQKAKEDYYTISCELGTIVREHQFLLLEKNETLILNFHNFDVKGQILANGKPLSNHVINLVDQFDLTYSSTTDENGNYIFPKKIEKYNYTLFFEIGNTRYDTTFVLDRDKTLDFNINTVLVDINEPEKIPTTYSLSQNYPNPFNPETRIDF
jgi:hypothetical protein